MATKRPARWLSKSQMRRVTVQFPKLEQIVRDAVDAWLEEHESPEVLFWKVALEAHAVGRDVCRECQMPHGKHTTECSGWGRE